MKPIAIIVQLPENDELEFTVEITRADAADAVSEALTLAAKPLADGWARSAKEVDTLASWFSRAVDIAKNE